MWETDWLLYFSDIDLKINSSTALSIPFASAVDWSYPGLFFVEEVVGFFITVDRCRRFDCKFWIVYRASVFKWLLLLLHFDIWILVSRNIIVLNLGLAISFFCLEMHFDHSLCRVFLDFIYSTVYISWACTYERFVCDFAISGMLLLFFFLRCIWILGLYYESVGTLNLIAAIVSFELTDHTFKVRYFLSLTR